MTPDTILLRQIHPNFYVDGKLSSQAFTPFPKDDGNLSVYNGAVITAEGAYEHYTKVLALTSRCVYGVTVSEVTSIELTAAPDPLPNFDSHAIIAFGSLSDRESRKLAKRLKAFADSRGVLHGT